MLLLLIATARLIQISLTRPSISLAASWLSAASEAGCRRSPGPRTSKGNQGKPYFERECRELRAKFRWALRHDVDSMRVLARRFSSVIRRKCRQYRQPQTPVLLRHLRNNHKVFWQKLNAHDSSLPAALSAHSACQAVTSFQRILPSGEGRNRYGDEEMRGSSPAEMRG